MQWYNEELQKKIRMSFLESEEEIARRQRQEKMEELKKEIWNTKYKMKQLHTTMQSNSFYAFLQSRGYVILDTKGKITSQQLYILYQKWCEDAYVTPEMPRSLWQYIKLSGEYYHIRPGYMMGPKGKRVRGFVGLRGCTPEEAADPDPRYRFRVEWDLLDRKLAQLEAQLKECNT